MKYDFIDAHRQRHDVRTLCRMFGLSTSSYYAARRRGPSARAERHADLTTQIRGIHIASRHTYGAPRIQVELAARCQLS